MKKIKVLIVFSLIIIMLAPLHINAMTAVGDIDVAYGKAEIDGKIDITGEWSLANKFTLSSANTKSWSGDIASDFKTDIYTLWDESGLYIAGIITDSTFKSSENDGYSGDAFQISIDLGQVFYGTNNSRAIFYSFGCYDDTAIVQVQESVTDRIINDGDEGVAIKTNATATGWEYELFLPWDVLHNDMNEKINENVEINAGLKINVMMCYLDRSDSGDLIAAFGTTVNDESVDFDWIPEEHGITLNLVPQVIEEVIAPVDSAAQINNSSAPTSTAAKAPQTADVIGIAVIMLIASGAGIIINKKIKRS